MPSQRPQQATSQTTSVSKIHYNLQPQRPQHTAPLLISLIGLHRSPIAQADLNQCHGCHETAVEQCTPNGIVPQTALSRATTTDYARLKAIAFLLNSGPIAIDLHTESNSRNNVIFYTSSTATANCSSPQTFQLAALTPLLTAFLNIHSTLHSSSKPAVHLFSSTQLWQIASLLSCDIRHISQQLQKAASHFNSHISMHLFSAMAQGCIPPQRGEWIASFQYTQSTATLLRSDSGLHPTSTATLALLSHDTTLSSGLHGSSHWEHSSSTATPQQRLNLLIVTQHCIPPQQQEAISLLGSHSSRLHPPITTVANTPPPPPKHHHPTPTATTDCTTHQEPQQTALLLNAAQHIS